MEAAVSLSSHNKQPRNRRRRSVTRQTSATCRGGGNKQPPLLPLPAAVPTPPTAAGFTPSKKKLSRHQSLNPRTSPPSKPHVEPREAASGPDRDMLRRGFVAPVIPYQAPPPVAAGEWLSGDFVFALAPPPSSLPLPRFCLRPKLRCTAEAGVEAGTADEFRRVLRLR